MRGNELALGNKMVTVRKKEICVRPSGRFGFEWSIVDAESDGLHVGPVFRWFGGMNANYQNFRIRLPQRDVLRRFGLHTLLKIENLLQRAHRVRYVAYVVRERPLISDENLECTHARTGEFKCKYERNLFANKHTKHDPTCTNKLPGLKTFLTYIGYADCCIQHHGKGKNCRYI